jgi:hypothetical protein
VPQFPRAPIPPEGDADSPNGGEGGDPGGQDKASALSRPAAPQVNEGQDEDITRYRINENVTAREAHKDSDAVNQVPEGMRVEENPTSSQVIRCRQQPRAVLLMCGRTLRTSSSSANGSTYTAISAPWSQPRR